MCRQALANGDIAQTKVKERACGVREQKHALGSRASLVEKCAGTKTCFWPCATAKACLVQLFFGKPALGKACLPVMLLTNIMPIKNPSRRHWGLRCPPPRELASGDKTRRDWRVLRGLSGVLEGRGHREGRRSSSECKPVPCRPAGCTGVRRSPPER
jgi:hypothetical protein